MQYQHNKRLPLLHLEFAIVLQDDTEMIFQNEGPAHRIVSQKFELLWVPQVMLMSGGKSWLMKIVLKLIDWHQPRGCWWHLVDYTWCQKSQSCFCLLLADP